MLGFKQWLRLTFIFV